MIHCGLLFLHKVFLRQVKNRHFQQQMMYVQHFHCTLSATMIVAPAIGTATRDQAPLKWSAKS